MDLNKWIARRENGFLTTRNDENLVMKCIYGAMDCKDEYLNLRHLSKYGAVFNLEFSRNGKVLAAAGERRAIQMFDTVTYKRIHVILNAHKDNVNCIKFLNDNMFASCSDDTTVSLWDMRYLKLRIRNLRGHSNWVKNVEYSCKDNLLISSGFDGSIFTWDINSYTEEGLTYQKVFHTSGLMRCALTPDDSKLVISSTGGYLMIIHQLDLSTLHSDLCGFRPSMYRLMQMSQQYIPQAAKFDHVFSKKQQKNRVEFVTDFPDGNDAEVILSLQIHPHGQAVLSRNISFDEKSEWSCVHNIHEEEYDITERVNVEPPMPHRRSGPRNNSHCRVRLEDDDIPNEIHSDSIERQSSTRSRLPNLNGMHLNVNGDIRLATAPSNEAGVVLFNRTTQSFSPDIWAAEVTVQQRTLRRNRLHDPNSISAYNYVYAINSGIIPTARNPPTDDSLEGNTTSSGQIADRPHSISPPLRLAGSPPPPPHPPTKKQIFTNAKKLMYYVEESYKAEAFIKEPCFSSDGRIICSPYGNGIRLLSFNDACAEFPAGKISDDNRIYQPSPLVVQKEIKIHKNRVLCSKFSPCGPLLVTGCQNGKIVWYNPYL